MSGQKEISLSLRTVAIFVFVLGISVGFVTGVVLSNQSGKLGGEVTGFSGDENPSPSPAQGDQNPGSEVSVSFETEGEPVLGESDAPVTIAYWGDFQCPFCKRYEQRTFPQIKENYISTGEVRYVFKDFQFLGSDSTTAGVASECVWKQVGNSDRDAYWEWKASMYDNQDGENSGWGSKQDILSMTGSVSGVNAQQVSSCMEDNRQKFEQEISEDQSEGSNVGITGTPGFVIYRTSSDTGQQITGAQPYGRFESVISQVKNSEPQETGTQPEPDKTVEVTGGGTEYSFSPSRITVEKGDTVRIEYSNTGSLPHNFKIPGLGAGTETIQSGEKDSFTFTAPKSGEFPLNFECSLPGHASSGMKGEIVSG